MAYNVRAVREHGTWLLTVPQVPEVVVRAANLDDGLRSAAVAIGAYVEEDKAEVEVVIDFRASVLNGAVQRGLENHGRL